MRNLPFDFGNHTDRGLVREFNEDAMGFYSLSGGYLWVVADGMGGHAAGDEASKLAVDAIYFFLHQQTVWEDIPNLLIQAIDYANQNIYQYALQYPQKRGMGTTVVVALVRDNTITIGHVGDSRAYRYNPETGLQALTKDHSFVQELVNQGLITEQEAHYHPRKNEITRALGTKENVIPDIQQHTIRKNDIFLLMTDGICSLLTHNEIQQILSDTTLNSQQIAEKLVNKANELGGYDNSTVQVISFKQTQNNQNQSLADTNVLELSFKNDAQKKEIKVPRSSTSDSSLRYYLFIGGAILTIALILFYFLSNLNTQNIVPPTNLEKNEKNYAYEDSLKVQEDSTSQKTIQEPMFIRYKVRRGQSLDQLSKWFNYPMDSIKMRNGLKNSKIKEGEELEFPLQAIYEVEKGDKLELIAKKFNVKASDIQRINALKSAEKISPGVKLYIPLPEK